MRVVQVMAGAEVGGAETAFVDMCIALRDAGVVQHVATRANDLRVGRLKDAGIPCTLLPFGAALDIYTPWKLRGLIRDFKPDIVQTWMSRAAAKVPAWRGRSAKPYTVVSRLGGYYKLKYYPNTDHFTTITPDIARYLCDRGVPPARITHINNFAEVEAPKQVMSRADYQTPAEALLLVSLGRLHQAKAFDTLLQAVAQVPDTYLWIGGDGPDAAALASLADTLGIADRVRFLGWWDDRAALLAAGDVCVFPSRYEPFGTVFVQAWAAGIPLITSLADGPRQYVRAGVDALTFEIDAVDQLVARIRELKINPELRARLAAAGRERYRHEFTREKTVSAYLDLYEGLRRKTV